MASIEKIATTVDVLATISLNANEINALDALAGYGVEQFIELFYKHMGRAYLEPHEAGLRSFLKSVAGCVGMVRAAEESREFLALCEADRRRKVTLIRKSLSEAGECRWGMSMTPEQRQAARERCDKATPGPWTLDTFYYCYIWGPHMQMVADDGLDEAGTLTRMRGVGANLPLRDNGDFIAHARTDLPAALDALDAAEARIAKLSAAPDGMCWQELVGLAANSEDTPMLIYRITSDYNRMRERIAELSEENSQMARMLAEPSENQELKARIAELESDAEFLTTPERLAEIIGEKNARIAELEADKARLDWLDRYRVCRELNVLVSYHAWENKHYGDIRAAIDAAMKPEQAPC